MNYQYNFFNSQKIKPFLKWAGGKTQLLEKFENYFPEELKSGKITNYYEPFLGSGAVFFYIVSKYKIKNVYLYDINKELVNIYKVIKQDCSKLIHELKRIEIEYHNLNGTKQEKYFYSIRTELNEQLKKIDLDIYSEIFVTRAAQHIFLNRTCYNGLFRLNRKGEFNVPFGKYKNPQILNENNLIAVSNILENVTIEAKEFEQVLSKIKSNSFVYLDPPYMPISKTSSFTSYSKEDFTRNDQIKLSDFFFKLTKKNKVWLMLSNSDPKNEDPSNTFFENYYRGRNKKIKIIKVDAKRMINCMANKRGNIKELVITNY